MLRLLLISLSLLAGSTALAAEHTVDRSLLALDRPADSIFVPVGAVVQRGGIAGVYIMQGSEAYFRSVRTGRVNQGEVQILSGLSGDETLLLADMAVLYDDIP